MTKKDEDRGLVATLKRVAASPWTGVATIASVVISTTSFLDPLIQFAGASVQVWFPLLGILQTIGSQSALLPAGLMHKLFIAGAVVYALYLLDSLIDRFTNRFS